MSNFDVALLGFPESDEQARAVSELLGIAYGKIAIHRFPDGEDRLILPESQASHIFLFRSLDRPHDKLIELLLASRTLRAQGVQRLTLVAPYLCYMRQDMAFHPGEVVSQKIIGQWLAELFDDVVTVEPHLHRISRLEQAIPARGRAMTLTASVLFSSYLAALTATHDIVLLGPDSESEQWVSVIAQAAGLEYAIARKTRRGDRSVVIELPESLIFGGKTVVILDDMASTGQTLAVAAEAVRERGAADVRVLVTHALFAEGCLERLKAAGINQIGSSDSIPHSTNLVSLAPLLAEGLDALLNLKTAVDG